MVQNDADAVLSMDTRYQFKSDPETVHSVVQRVLDDLNALTLSDDHRADLKILLVEVINNIIKHGYQRENSKPIELSLTMRSSSRSLKFVFMDFGLPMPFGKIQSDNLNPATDARDQLPEGGFGWQIIRQLAHDIRYERNRRVNSLSLKLDIAEIC
jgi:serine/threonine-protein kinase RsbW